MSNIFNVLQSAYASAAQAAPLSNKPYTNVDPKSYQGSWQGTYSDNTAFEFTISQVHGFRAVVRYQSGSTVQAQQVLIRDSSFRIGNTKFVLSGTGEAQVGTVLTNAVTGNDTLIKGSATLS
jgi:hypothetical protein